MLFTILTIIAMLISTLGFVLGVYRTVKRTILAFCGILAALILLWVVSCFVVTRFIDMDKEYLDYSKFYWWFTYSVIQFAIIIFGTKLKVSGKDFLPKEKFMLVCNHRSIVDPLITMGALKEHRLSFIARKEVYWIPIISKLMHRCQCFCLDRDDMKESAKTIRKASRWIKADNGSIGVFPEGTRNREEEMLPFMNGAFKIAKKANCPIVVATLKNTEKVAKRAPFRSTTVYLDIVGVLDKEFVAENNTAHISDTARAMMEKSLCN